MRAALRIALILAAAAFALLPFALPARAATYTVCDSGCDETCATAQTRLSAMVAGDELVLTDVTCTGLTLTMPGVLSPGVTIRGSGTAVLDGNNATAIGIVFTRYGTVDGVTVQNYTSHCLDASGSSQADFTLTGSTISGCAGNGVDGVSSNSVIERNTFTGVTGTATVRCVNSTTVTNNVFSGNGAYLQCANTATARHNTFDGQTGTRAYVADVAIADFNSFSNNAASTAVLRAGTSESYNNFNANTAPADCSTACAGTDTTSAPGYVDQPGGDLRLAAGSALIDGATGSGEPDDRTGVGTRTDGTADVGAYEYVPTGLPAGVWGANGVTRDWGANGTTETWGANGSTNGGPR